MATPVRILFEAVTAGARAEVNQLNASFTGQREIVAAAAKTIQETARANVAAVMKEREALQGTLVAYREIATEAKRGSEQQIAANRLAADSARALGIAYEEAGAAAATASKRASTAMGESGVARGLTSRLSGIGGWMAGPGFIAGAAVGIGIDVTLKEMQKEQEALALLKNALHDTGISWNVNSQAITRNIEATQKSSGFFKTDLSQSLATLVRGTGDLTKSEQMLSIATDVARGRHMALNAAVLLVLKAHEGNVGALRRLGIDIPKVTTSVDELKNAHVKASPELKRMAAQLDKNATGVEALRVVQQKYSGAAATFVHTLGGQTDTLKNNIRDLAGEIGLKLQPSIRDLLTWLNKEIDVLKTSKRFHEDVKQAVHDLKVAFFDLKGVVVTVGPVLNSIVKATVGWKTAFEIILTGILAAKFLSLASTIATKLIPAIISIGTASEASAGASGIGGLIAALRTVTAASMLARVAALAASFGAIATAAGLAGAAVAALMLATDKSKTWNVKGGVVSYDAGTKQYSFQPGGAGRAVPISAAQAAQATGGRSQTPTSGGVPSKGGPGGQGGGKGGKRTYSYSGLASLWVSAGGDSSIQNVMAAIALAESSGRSDAIGGPNSNGTYDYGCWQINSSHHFDTAELLAGDQTYNAKCAVSIHGSQGLGAWSTYNSGAYLKYMQGNSSRAGGTGGPTAAGLAAGIAGSPSSVHHKRPKKGPAMATPAQEAGLSEQLGIDVSGIGATIRQLHEDGNRSLDKALEQIRARMVRIRSELQKHLTSKELSNLRQQYSNLHRQLSEDMKKAHAIITQWQNKIKASWSIWAQGAIRAFDQVTKTGLRAMQEGFSHQMRAFDRVTEAGLQKYVVAQTPAEAALAALQAGKAASDLATAISDAKSALAQAQATGDPVAIAAAQKQLDDAQYNQRLDDLSKQAVVERTGQDKLTAVQQRAYQDQRDDLKQALTDQESDREDAYTTMRDDQRTALENLLKDLETALLKHKKSWREVGKALGDAFGQGIVDGANAALRDAGKKPVDGAVSGPITHPPPADNGIQHPGPAFASGGIVGGSYVGVNDTVMARLTPGEYVVDRETTKQLLAGGLGGGRTFETHLHFHDKVIGAGNNRELARQLARLIQPQIERQVGFKNL